MAQNRSAQIHRAASLPQGSPERRAILTKLNQARVANLDRIAGAVDFSDYGKGTNPRSIFQDLREDARHEYGSRGYTGSIAEKDEFKLRSNTPMTMNQAREFVDRDLSNSDKWGPAFAVPIASSKVMGEKEYTVRVTAKTKQDAWRVAQEIITAKGRSRKGAHVEVRVSRVIPLKGGGVPSLSVTDAKSTYFTIHNRGFGTKRYSSKREAVAAAKDSLVGTGVPLGAKVLLSKVQDLSAIEKSGESSKLPTWEATGVRKQVAMGRTEGYLFYGMAPS